ncbi:hypothetical protein UFOVP225_117 [uncultured Caudovirales phage]|uniref:Uncharacterized protein n=1 Tax=uncultured Caudovirales phage TaxID=2100421 RepID=A0A6J5L3Q6_9CAUD|nr:hypothetical protein UFOVP113_130 [uncultured Caudovirales phage]CAB5219718.1 hypothetical protein UFOVP225_117 [uncultured Caudovirales phage]
MSIIAYDAGLKDGKSEVIQKVLDKISDMMVDPPMRGDVALSDLRRFIDAEFPSEVKDDH